MNVNSLLDSLNLVHYEYDDSTHIAKVKRNASEYSKQRELIKITFYLSSKNIVYDVLANHSILIGSKAGFLLKIKRLFSF